MDPIGPINIDADSTFRIAEEAQARGHELFYYTPDHLSFREGRVMARGWPLAVRRVEGDHYTLGERRDVDLSEFEPNHPASDNDKVLRDLLQAQGLGRGDNPFFINLDKGQGCRF